MLSCPPSAFSLLHGENTVACFEWFLVPNVIENSRRFLVARCHNQHVLSAKQIQKCKPMEKVTTKAKRREKETSPFYLAGHGPERGGAPAGPAVGPVAGGLRRRRHQPSLWHAPNRVCSTQRINHTQTRETARPTDKQRKHTERRVVQGREETLTQRWFFGCGGDNIAQRLVLGGGWHGEPRVGGAGGLARDSDGCQAQGKLHQRIGARNDALRRGGVKKTSQTERCKAERQKKEATADLPSTICM